MRGSDAGSGGPLDRFAGICVLFVDATADTAALVLHENGHGLRGPGIDEIVGHGRERQLLPSPGEDGRPDPGAALRGRSVAAGGGCPGPDASACTGAGGENLLAAL